MINGHLTRGMKYDSECELRDLHLILEFLKCKCKYQVQDQKPPIAAKLSAKSKLASIDG